MFVETTNAVRQIIFTRSVLCELVSSVQNGDFNPSRRLLMKRVELFESDRLLRPRPINSWVRFNPLSFLMALWHLWVPVGSQFSGDTKAGAARPHSGRRVKVLQADWTPFRHAFLKRGSV